MEEQPALLTTELTSQPREDHCIRVRKKTADQAKPCIVAAARSRGPAERRRENHDFFDF